MRSGLFGYGGAALLAAASSHAVAARQPIGVGAPEVNGARLKPYNNAWLLKVILPDGKTRDQGVWSDHLETATIDGRPALRRVQGMTYVNGLNQSVVNTFDPATCGPLVTEGHDKNGQVLRHTFAGKHVSSEWPPDKDKRATKTSFDAAEPLFDFYGGMYGLLLSCFPLKVGYTNTLLALGEDKDEAEPLTFTVVRKEKVSAGSRGMVDAFVTVADTPGRYTQTFWLSPDPPYIIRLLITFPDKSKEMSFDMI